MDATVLKIALAGLMHDVGKFSQDCMEVSRQYRDANEDLYLPKFDGRPSHRHALYTAAFIEQYAELLPRQLTDRNWGEGDILLNLAACHHKPETAMQWVITMADRISSGLDRSLFESGEKIAYQDFKKTRLLPVLEALGPDRKERYTDSSAYRYRYPLAPLSAAGIFPELAADMGRREAQAEYQALFDSFTGRLKELYHRESVALWAEHFDSLLMAHTCIIPAARVGEVVHDVSLYDHARTTAALAAALYRFHSAAGSLTETAVRETGSQKFLLVSGDFYGIQDFIFSTDGEVRKFRSKLLRGRSFSVSLLTELAAHLVCEKLDLPFLSVVLNAAGKFHLIAANVEGAKEAIREAETEINDWLFEHTFGQSGFGLTATPAAADDFHAGRFGDLWDLHLQNLEERKYCKVDLERHGGAVEGFLDSFNSSLERPLCPLCGKRPSVPEAENDTAFAPDQTSSCALCRDHVLLGRELVKSRMVAVLDASSELKKSKGLLVPVFGSYQVSFADSPLGDRLKEGSLVKLWEIAIQPDGTPFGRATARFMNGYVPCYRPEDNHDDCLLESAKSDETLARLIEEIKEGIPKTFSHIAVKARHPDPGGGKCRGIEALGVLKADVDNLGMLFGCGLTRERFTLSRLATMSRQLNNFFVLHLPHLLANDSSFREVYTVFAGGDDLFLIGPWNRMAALALELRKRFDDYVCGNEELTFSAGLSVHKAHMPVDKLAEAAEEALCAAKRGGRNRVTMFDETVSWDDFEKLLAGRADMESWLARGYVSDAMFYRFNHFVAMAAEEELLPGNGPVDIDDLECLKWRALFRYSLARNVNRKTEAGERAVDEVAALAGWLEQHRGAVRIPLWHVLYEKRSSN